MHTQADGEDAANARSEGPLERLLRAHATSLHLRSSHDEREGARPGSVLEVDPAWGRGFCWCCPIDEEIAVFSCELCACKDAAAACLTPDHFSVTAHRKARIVSPRTAPAPADPQEPAGTVPGRLPSSAHPQHVGHGVGAARLAAAPRLDAHRGGAGHPVHSPAPHAKAPDAVLEESAVPLILGSAWKGQSFLPLPRADEYAHVTGIVLLPRGLQRMSLRCQCDPLMLSGAIAALDGTKPVEGLARVMDDIACARPSSVVARAYYESKITEAMSLIVDWHLSGKSARKARLSAVDRTALNRARRYLADNLDRAVATEELCAVACMSASKLTSLFKAAEGATPQEYARALRMERACKLLSRTDLPLSAISAQLGFQRQGSFSEAFKTRFGMTPREFRQLARKR